MSESLGVHLPKLQKMVDKLNENPILRYLQPQTQGPNDGVGAASGSGSNQAGATARPHRTMCMPAFTVAEAPLKLDRLATPTAKMSADEFETKECPDLVIIRSPAHIFSK